MRTFVFFLFVILAANAVAPTIYEQANNGFYKFPELLYSIRIDCNEGRIDLFVMDANFTKLNGSNTYLKYVDFSTGLISANATNSDGFTSHKLPGNTSYMRGMFILVIERKGYRSREIHFDISGCYRNTTSVEIPTGTIVISPAVKNDTEIQVQEEKEVKTDEVADQGTEDRLRGDGVWLVLFGILVLFIFVIGAHLKRKRKTTG